MRKAGIPVRGFFILAVLVLILLLLPMIKAAQYDVPAADDYSYGQTTHRAWVNTGSITAVLKAACSRVRDTWYNWQGSFAAVFMFTLVPSVFGDQCYGIGALMILTVLLIGIFVLTFAVYRRGFKASVPEAGILGCVWAVLCTQFLPRASQGIYWYNGAVYYTFFFGIACAACSLLISYLLRTINENGIGRLITASVLLFFIGGGNLVTGLTTAILLVSTEFLLICRRHRDRLRFLLPTVCLLAGFMINVIAPGNAVRQKYFAGYGAVKAVWMSFVQAGRFFAEWFSLPVAALILLTIPVLWMITGKTKFSFSYPGIITLYAVCLTAAMFCPPVYAMTEHNLEHLGRIINIIYFGMMFLLIFVLFYWVGWLRRRGVLSEERFAAASAGKINLIYTVLMLMIFAFGMTQIKWYDTTSISAFNSYRSGQMGSYYHTYKQRLEILNDPEIEDAVLKRYPVRPYVLFFQELSPIRNIHVARWYNKESVIIK